MRREGTAAGSTGLLDAGLVERLERVRGRVLDLVPRVGGVTAGVDGARRAGDLLLDGAAEDAEHRERGDGDHDDDDDVLDHGLAGALAGGTLHGWWFGGWFVRCWDGVRGILRPSLFFWR